MQADKYTSIAAAVDAPTVEQVKHRHKHVRIEDDREVLRWRVDSVSREALRNGDPVRAVHYCRVDVKPPVTYKQSWVCTF